MPLDSARRPRTELRSGGVRLLKLGGVVEADDQRFRQAIPVRVATVV